MKSNRTAQQAYTEQLESFKSNMERIQSKIREMEALSDEGLGLNWGDVGDVEHLAGVMQELCDKVYREGEYETPPTK